MPECVFYRTQIILALIALCSCLQPKPLKQEYVIGGWIPGTAAQFLQKWRPALQDYLTATFGTLYNPPITFKLIAADYSQETLSRNLINAGQVDFICE